MLQQKLAWPKSACLAVPASTAGNNHSWDKSCAAFTIKLLRDFRVHLCNMCAICFPSNKFLAKAINFIIYSKLPRARPMKASGWSSG